MKIKVALLFCQVLLSGFVVFWQAPENRHRIEPGDTWIALAYRFGLTPADLQAANPALNRQRPPVIGSTITLPEGAEARMGVLARPYGNTVGTAVRHHLPPWQIALQNELASPYTPQLYQPVFLPGGETPPRDLPIGIASLELSQAAAQPGQALGVRGRLMVEGEVTVALGGAAMDSFTNGRHFVALTGLGGFFGNGQPELAMQVEGQPWWGQPWQVNDPDLWQYQQLTLTGEAAAIDQESIRAEGERLLVIWQQNSPRPQWTAAFTYPISQYLEISSPFGARRSYNGGPYRTYHEGLDFSAYSGTPVYAPAAGTVVLAERLYVRGGAVILDHGLGIYSGYYHMSEVLVAPGEVVQPGQTLGAVGTTGLSTGNHLHWDLLVNAVWVDAQAWLDQDMACWILQGIDQECQ